MLSAPTSVPVKLLVKQSRRRARLNMPLRLTALQQCIHSCFPDLVGHTLNIEYVDDEGDNIVVSTDVELQEAQRVYEALGRVLSFVVSASEAKDSDNNHVQRHNQHNRHRRGSRGRRPQDQCGRKGSNGYCKGGRGKMWRKMARAMGLVGPRMPSPWSNPNFRHMVQAAKGCVPHFHYGITCDGSGQHPLIGTRYHKVGEDYDLNEAEFAKLSASEQQAYEAIAYPGAQPVPISDASGVSSVAAVPIVGALLPDNVPLSMGAFGPGIAKLQHVLIELGFMDASAIRWRAGIYGPRTTEAVAKVATAMGSASESELGGVFTAAIRAYLLEQLSQVPDHAEHEAKKTQKPERLECTFVQDLTVPDDTAVEADQDFNKKWLVKTGAAGWPAGCTLAHVSGDTMGAQTSISLSEQAPHALVELSVTFTAPATTGTKVVSKWRVVGPDGQAFGDFVWVTVKVNAAADEKEFLPHTPDAEAPVTSDSLAPAASPTLRQLIAMGFDDVRASAALDAAAGDLSKAVSALLR